MALLPWPLPLAAGKETDGFMLLDYCPTTLLDMMQRSNFNLDSFFVYEVGGEGSWWVGGAHRVHVEGLRRAPPPQLPSITAVPHHRTRAHAAQARPLARPMRMHTPHTRPHRCSLRCARAWRTCTARPRPSRTAT